MLMIHRASYPYILANSGIVMDNDLFHSINSIQYQQINRKESMIDLFIPSHAVIADYTMTMGKIHELLYLKSL